MAVVHRSVSATEACGTLSGLIAQAALAHERVVIESHGKPVAAVISAEDLSYFEQLEQDAQDREDIRDAEAARAEAEREGTKSLEELATELGL